MRFRSLALLAAAAIVLSFGYGTILLNAFAAKISQSNLELWLNFAASYFLPTLALSLFFFCFGAEGLGRIGAGARAIAAMISASLMVLYVGGVILRLGVYVLTLSTVPSLSLDRSLVANRLFSLIGNLFWVAFLVAFAIKNEMAASRVIPRVASVLAVFTLSAAAWTSVQLYDNRDPLGLAARNYAALLIGWAPQTLFLVMVWKRWRPDLPVHPNIVS